MYYIESFSSGGNYRAGDSFYAEIVKSGIGDTYNSARFIESFLRASGIFNEEEVRSRMDGREIRSFGKWRKPRNNFTKKRQSTTMMEQSVLLDPSSSSSSIVRSIRKRFAVFPLQYYRVSRTIRDAFFPPSFDV